jgi:hypothetical protein
MPKQLDRPELCFQPMRFDFASAEGCVDSKPRAVGIGRVR